MFSSNEKTNNFHCAVCDCTLNDSLAYLDHINGKRHLKNCGKTPISDSTLEEVKLRYEKMKRESMEKYDFYRNIQLGREKRELKKAKDKARKKRKKSEY